MKATEIHQSIEKLKIDAETKKGLLEIIDIKIENDMKEVLNEIKRLEDKQDTKFSMLIWAMGILMALMIALKFFSN
jgi:predicted nucleic acid-binding Zn ribbon protein